VIKKQENACLFIINGLIFTFSKTKTIIILIEFINKNRVVLK